jgi:hypothetical protein
MGSKVEIAGSENKAHRKMASLFPQYISPPEYDTMEFP